MPELVNPHDKFFKKIFSNKPIALDFLRHYLPPEVLALLQPETLEICKDSFVDDNLKESFADILYAVNLAGEPGYIYLLFEHKSFPYYYTALQLLKYLVSIWETHLKQYGKTRLPLTIPLVLYHGSNAWTLDNRFSALFGPIPTPFLPFVPDFSYLLYDLSRYSDEEIKGDVLLKVFMLALKYIMRDDLRDKLPEIFQLITNLTDKQSGLAYLELLLRYLAQGTDKLTKEDFTKAKNIIAAGGMTMPTLAEQWFDDGLQKGKQEGLLEGTQKGLLAIHQVILELVEEHFGAVNPALPEKLQRIHSYEVLRLLRRQLKHCADQAAFLQLVEQAL